MARQRIPIPFGGGLDRHTGPMVVDPSSQEDVRGVHLAEGWAHVRRGVVEVSQLSGIAVAGEQLRTEDVLILVTYDAVSREVHVYRAASNGANPVHVAKWFDLAAGADEPPRVFMAEVAGRMFMAHDEAVFSRRAPTVSYDRITGTLSPLEAEWAHEGGIRFRGVVAHLGVYLAGWGYGTQDEARPDVVRMSMPNEPTVFHLKYYEPIGQRGEAVIRCVSTGRTLLCWNGAQMWEHFGSDRSTFGARPIDTQFGLSASRLAAEIDGAVYFWSRTGPRRTSGGLSEDLAIPLELGAPSPADLVAEGAHERAFATLYPDEHEVWFVFGRRVYAYSLRTGRWRYDELGFEPAAAILSQPGVDVDPGYEPGIAADLRVTEDVLADGGMRDVTVEWDNVAMAGDEILEFWVHDGEEWAQAGSAAVEPQGVQDHTFEGMDPGKAYRFQIRARRGTMYRDGYTSSDPGDWPAGSLLLYTTEITAPQITASAWERTSPTAARLNFTVAVSHPGLRVELLRDDTVVDFADPPLTSPVTLRDETMAIEEDHEYVVRQVTADLPEGGAADPVTRWAGPTAPTGVVFDGGPPESAYWYRYEVTWNARAGRDVRIQDDYLCASEYELRHTGESDGGQSITSLQKNSEMADDGTGLPYGFTARIRHEVTTHGVTDVSPWVSGPVAVRIAVDETAAGSCGGGNGNGGGGGDPGDPPIIE